MLFRFSLYGLLKNQRYFEPFLLLAMLDAGLGFAQIGVLVALRELTTAALEIPSGAIADVFGRRRSMVLAFLGYVTAYVALALGDDLLGFAVGMALIGAGDAFRTGAHKAMIFDWLVSQGREGERVRVYGYTRSWSQIGSAISVPIAALTVYLTGVYTYVFWLAAVPAAVNAFNLATYPAVLNGTQAGRSIRAVAHEVWDSARAAMRDRALRGLLLEAAAFGGSYKVLKDYLQPVVAALALSTAFLGDFEETQAIAVTAGAIYVVLHLLAALASRRAHRWVEGFADITRAAWWLWIAALGSYAALSFALAAALPLAAVLGFVVLALLHNIFRPVLVSRIDTLGRRESAATVLSVESQATSTAAVVLAPAIGLCVDATASGGVPALWPAAAAAAGVAVLVVVFVARR
jgi:MFS family permease